MKNSNIKIKISFPLYIHCIQSKIIRSSKDVHDYGKVSQHYRINNTSPNNPRDHSQVSPEKVCHKINVMYTSLNCEVNIKISFSLDKLCYVFKNCMLILSVVYTRSVLHQRVSLYKNFKAVKSIILSSIESFILIL